MSFNKVFVLTPIAYVDFNMISRQWYLLLYIQIHLIIFHLLAIIIAILDIFIIKILGIFEVIFKIKWGRGIHNFFIAPNLVVATLVMSLLQIIFDWVIL